MAKLNEEQAKLLQILQAKQQKAQQPKPWGRQDAGRKHAQGGAATGAHIPQKKP
jgi:hypothetical protein